MLQRDGVVMTVMKVLLLLLMMILMKPSLMKVTIVMIFPLREGISPADFCLLESFLSLCFPPRRGGGVFLRSSSSS
jgi:hypothetical protein